MQTITTDVLVIGSGFGGAAPALRLSQAGLRVRVIEKGPAVDVSDFRQTQDPKYITRYIRGLSGDQVHLTYAEALGGGSGFYEMVSLRAPSLAFEQRDVAGRRMWPEAVTRGSLDPWYDLAERMLNVEQIAEHEVPRSGLVFALMMKQLGMTCERARYAVRNCLGSGFCVTGCIYGAKQSLHLNYLPQAVAAGAEVDCGIEAEGIRVLPPRRANGVLPSRYEVRARRTGSGERLRYRAAIVVLAGGTVGTGTLLLRSRKDLPGLSPVLGQRITLNAGVKVAGLLPDAFPDGDMFAGRSHPGMISYHFLASHGFSVSAVKAMPIQAVTAARLRLDGDSREPAWWGEEHSALMEQFRHRVIVLSSFGLTPPAAALTLAEDGSPRLRLVGSPELTRHCRDAREVLRSILADNGCRLIDATWIDRGGEARGQEFYSTAHQTGAAPMGDDWTTGVTDPAGMVWGRPGLYVSDGGAIPTSLAVNTSLTILANAERIAAAILRDHDIGPKVAVAGR